MKMLFNKAMSFVFLVFVLLLISCISCQLCGVSLWKKITMKDILVADFLETVNVTSGTSCAELCALTSQCKSFAVSSIFTDQMSCYLYKYRVWNYNVLSNFTGLIYYWLIEENCPIERGFTYNKTLNVCAKRLTTPVKNWTRCLRHCETEGGHLGIVNSQQELDMFYILTGGISSFLGARISEGLFKWLNGALVSGYWFAGEPNNHLGREETIMTLYSHGGLFDTDLMMTDSCICEIPLLEIYPL